MKEMQVPLVSVTVTPGSEEKHEHGPKVDKIIKAAEAASVPCTHLVPYNVLTMNV